MANDECDGTLDWNDKAVQEERARRQRIYRIRKPQRRTDDSRYQGGYRTFSDGSCREDFGSDR